MLNKKRIRVLIEEKKLVENYINLETQLTPNGFDLTAGAISRFSLPGAVDFSNKERIIPSSEAVTAEKPAEEKYGWWKLCAGAYKIKTNETINLPNDLTALAFSRSSLLRMGCFTQHGVWDAGFCGRGEFILIVANQKGTKIKENARIAQLVFIEVEKTTGYEGIHKNLT